MIDNNKKYILTIEGIRGFAAIYVMLGHFVLLYKPYTFTPGLEFVIKTLFGYGHQAVILFFIVSGFSIHYSSTKYDFTNKRDLNDYFFKRIRRIYPLFLISLLIALVVLYITKSPSDWNRNILSFLFLTDISKGAIVDPIQTNFPIWSLSYEIIYYLLYPFLLFYLRKFNLKKILIISFIVSLLAGFFEFANVQNHLSNVIQLYWVWVMGVIIAEFKMKNIKISITYFYGIFVISIAMMFTLEKLFLLRDWAWALFFSLLILSYFKDSEKLTFNKKIINVTIGLIGIGTCYLLTNNENVLFHPIMLRFILVLMILLTFMIVFIPIQYFQNYIRILLSPFVKAGYFSYAIYIFHWPLILLFRYK